MNFIKKWYIYQKERFPILTFGLYVFCITIAVFCFTTSLMGTPLPYVMQWNLILPMFIVAFLQFLMIRIIDEFKDYKEDCKYRPYRPVPRGLITLKELKILFVICAILQLIITIYANPKGLTYLFIMWVFFAIMSIGFFIKKFLDKHILIEVCLDELLMPIRVLYLASYIGIYTDIWKILLMSYVISWIVEIARKIRCKEDEEKGVKTYTAVFGIKKATLILFTLETILMIIQIIILGQKYIALAIGAYIIVNLINLLFVIKKNKIMAKLTELSANIYIIISYLSLILLII